MTNLEIIAESCRGLLAQACLFALLLIAGVAVVAKILKEIRVAFFCLWQKSRFSFAAVVLLSLTMFLWADKTNLLRMIIHPGMSPKTLLARDGDGAVFRGDAPATFFNLAWNRVRVVRRGPGQAAESASCGTSVAPMFIIMR